MAKEMFFSDEQINGILSNIDKVVFIEDNRGRYVDHEVVEDRILPMKEELYRRYEEMNDYEGCVPLNKFIPSKKEILDINDDLNAWIYRKLTIASQDGKIKEVKVQVW